MGDGIRIQPRPERRLDYGDMRGRLVVVRDLSRPVQINGNSPTCRHCGYVHECKTYHLQLDGDGTVIVSHTVWVQLQKLYDCGGFEKVNVVGSPPDQGLTLAPVVRPLEFGAVNGHH